MEVIIFGAGYVGLVTGAGLASTGNQVTLVDTSREKIEVLLRGELPIFEPNLKELLQEASKRGNLHFLHSESPTFAEALNSAEIYFIAVGTPEDAEGKTNLQYVYSAVQMIAKQASDLHDKTVVMKSTIPVGTCDEVDSRFKQFGKAPRVVSNPEFLKQGNAVQDFLKPERVIIGTEDAEAIRQLSFLYKPFMLKRERLVFMKRRSAEFVKYACNAYLATRISFINELAQFSELIGADIREIREGMISDSRIGDKFLFPGLGFGGSCFPKDIHSLLQQAESKGFDLKLARSTDQINQKQKLWAFEKLQKHYGPSLKGKTICLWGLSFKPNTDDLREAPSGVLIQNLIKAGARVRAYDPAANEKAAKEYPEWIREERMQLFFNAYEAARESHALVLVTEWQEFRTPSFKKLSALILDKVLVDGRNIYDREIATTYGFHYYSVGS